MKDTKRSCGTCTKCCEGYLPGSAHGITFYPGKPCHFVSIGKGCSSYANRPEDPCKTYKCSWISNDQIPEWMRPEYINAIIDERTVEEIPYLNVKEAGSTLNAKVLTWLIQYAMSNNLNILWEVEGSKNTLGSSEFLNAIQNVR
jgi:hypothetical protein